MQVRYIAQRKESKRNFHYSTNETNLTKLGTHSKLKEDNRKPFDRILTCSSIAVWTFSSSASRATACIMSRLILSLRGCSMSCSKSPNASPISVNWASCLAKSCFSSSKARVIFWMVSQMSLMLLEMLLKWSKIWWDTSCRESSCSVTPSNSKDAL